MASKTIPSPEATTPTGEVDNDNDDSDTATVSYDDDDESSTNSQYSYTTTSSNDSKLSMPILKYARLMGSLPRTEQTTNDDDDTSGKNNITKAAPFANKVTASTIGRVIIRPSQQQTDNKQSEDINNIRNNSGIEYNNNEEDETDKSLTKVHHVIALGYTNGEVKLVDLQTGKSVLFGSTEYESGCWYVTQPTKSSQTKKNSIAQQSSNNVVVGDDANQRITNLSFDSTTKYLCVLNYIGNVAIFGPLLWGHSTSSTTASFTLVKPPTSTVRFTYEDTSSTTSITSSLLGNSASNTNSSTNKAHPTCMVLDPSYSSRKEKSLLVGYNDGQLKLSKLVLTVGSSGGKGGGITSLFSGGSTTTTVKKVDSVLYQGSTTSLGDGQTCGIESVTWRGSLVAWADSSGIRLFDIESMSRIAHIDKPTGARSSLYPSISTLKPCIVFEKSNVLLIGWGDCLMSLLVRDSKSGSSSSGTTAGAAQKDGAQSTTTSKARRKTVEASMAWELDCVACDVVPVDEKHVAVLGLVPSPSLIMDGSEGEQSDDNEQQTLHQDYTIAGGDNMLELQIINRESGKSISNDRLPLLEGPQEHQQQGDTKKNHITAANATEFRLLSSFACPRMDGNAEWEALDNYEKESLIGRRSDDNSPQRLTDLHLQWDLDKDICSTGYEIQSEAAIYDDNNNDDKSISSNAASVCSDNYVFSLSEPIGDLLDSVTTGTPPPIMAVVYSYDACLVQTRDVDDVISYRRSLGKSALALRQCLTHRQNARRHGLELLIDDFFLALLRMGGSSTTAHARKKKQQQQRPLSFSRLKIASESLPILLGGDARMWQRWIFMFSRIPGGLFVIREKIPVRDPELPSFVFEMSLEKMLEETLSNVQDNLDTNEAEPQHGEEEKLFGDKMIDLFLETMRSWGPTSALRRRIQLHRYCAKNQQWGLQWQPSSHSSTSAVAPFIQQAEKDLHRRISQTAFGVLANAHHSSLSGQGNSTIRQYIDSSKDSLFDVEHLISRLGTRLQPHDAEEDSSDSLAVDGISSNVVLSTMSDNSTVIVESMAELELMRERFDRALGYYLAIGSHFMTTESLPRLEEAAVQSVNNITNSHSPMVQEDKLDKTKYLHLLSMIELHQLSHLLLKRSFFFVNENDDSMAEESPIIALIMLVGLPRVGRFLMDNCSPLEGTSTDDAEVLYGMMPLNLVAKQLNSRPKLLYWFLFQVFIHKADMYVRFPTTAVPPAAITKLHQLQFSLFTDCANENVSKKSSESPAALMANEDTPFTSFLRATLPHGGIQADDVREKLTTYRGGSVDSLVFARELAFVIESFGKDTVDDAKEVLQLYIRGEKNLYMAVAYAERNTKHSSILWDILVEYCTTVDPLSSSNETNQSSGAQGALFGSLLEAAAHTGSDLATLVTRIPEGMSIQGLRPKLIAAISDYRYKVKIHEQVDDILMEDKVSILRELSHVSRRGERITIGDERSSNARGAKESSEARILLNSHRHAPRNKTTTFSLPIR